MSLSASDKMSKMLQISPPVGSGLDLPSNVNTMRPPVTISSERDLRKREKSLLNCAKQAFATLAGVVLE